MSQADEHRTISENTTPYAGLRVGDAERQAAITALGDQWRAGRLDPAEHERRTTAAFSAQTRGDLDVLFADLPQAAGSAAPAEAAPTPAPTGTGTSSPQAVGEGASSWLVRNRGAVYSLIPLVAVLLFFTLHHWIVFLLIPIAYTLLGTVGGATPGRDRHRNRRGGC